MAGFDRYIGIDYSGADTPTTNLDGLRVYQAGGGSAPSEAFPRSPRKHWTRRVIAEWLAALLAEGVPTLVGIDHGFSFPLDYFDAYHLSLDWPAFLDDFQLHWPTNGDKVRVEDVRRGRVGNGADRAGDSHWRRITERRVRAKSNFHYDVPGSVAKSTHAGLPWLRFLRERAAGKVHFWPFDGWDIPVGRSAVVEVYPALWSRDTPGDDRDGHQQDAFAVAWWLQRADRGGTLSGFLHPHLEESERKIAEIEGWILGVS